MTPLHNAVIEDDMFLLGKFLDVHLKSIFDVTFSSQNVFQIAIENDRVKSFNFLVKRLNVFFKSLDTLSIISAVEIFENEKQKRGRGANSGSKEGRRFAAAQKHSRYERGS